MLNIMESTTLDLGATPFMRSAPLPSDADVARLRPYELKNYALTSSDAHEEVVTANVVRRRLGIAPVKAVRERSVNTNSLPIQIWEGTVMSVDSEMKSMDVLLDAKIGQLPRHMATISLEWVTDQDIPLVTPGAVFYLTLYKQSELTTVRNAEEIRFRRLPSWSSSQIRRIHEDVEFLKSSFSEI